MVDALPHAVVVHATEGRTRLRIAERREDAVFFASVTTRLSTIAGVQKVEVRPLTGSILIFHDAPLSLIREAAKKNGLFSLVEETAQSGSREGPVFRISSRKVVATGLGLIALWQVYKEKIFPSALTVALYAVNLAGLLPADETSSAAD